jgi:hypothetical protein
VTGLDVELVPERGLDLGDASFGGRRIAWLPGGLMFTAGLRNVGVPSEGEPQHGRYRSLPAEDVRIERGGGRVLARARAREGPLELHREVTLTSGGVEVRDATRNLGTESEPAPLLYHCNFRWDGLEVEIDSDEVVPRDADAAAGDPRELGPPGPERVYEHLGVRSVRVRSGPALIEVRSSLPRLWQWIDPGLGVLGIEPANCSVLGRAHDRAEGRLPVLAPGEERATSLTIEVEEAR